MHKSQKLRQIKKRRERTLNICLPHVIKDKKDVENLFIGNFHVKLPRQSSRSCHVIFPSIEDKIKNYKFAKSKTINGKRILIKSLHNFELGKNIKKVKKKKIFMPKIEPDIKVTQTLFIGNIAINTKSDEIRSILPGCISVTLLKPYNKCFRSAIVKMENIQIAAEYLKKKRNWPVLKGHKIYLKADTRIKHKRRVSTNNTEDTIKIYGEDGTEEHEANEIYKRSD